MDGGISKRAGLRAGLIQDVEVEVELKVEMGFVASLKTIKSLDADGRDVVCLLVVGMLNLSYPDWIEI